jgi:hypothetical protein
MSNLKRGPYIDASYHVSVHLATQLQRRWFLRNTKNKNWRWWWRLLTDRDKMGKLHRGPSVYAFCQDSVHLAKRFQRRKFKCIKLTDDGRRKTDVNPCSVASLLATTLYQGNPDRNNKLWNIESTKRYILHMQVLLECYYIWMESSQWDVI